MCGGKSASLANSLFMFFKVCSFIRIIKSMEVKKWGMEEKQEKRENNTGVLFGKLERDL